LKIIEDDEETKMKSTQENIPPPPPEFANESSIDESASDTKVELSNVGKGEFHVAVHQDIRRSFSVDSPSSSNLISNNKLNTSMVTISDTSNSLAVNSRNQVTVVTTHPPVIIDNSSEVVIISNDTNKSHVQEDDDYQNHDSLESSPKNKSLKKLDESEVLIVSPFEEEEVEECENNEKEKRDFDTSHVSVVTVGDEQVKVKDSSHLVEDELTDGIEFSKTNGKVVYNSKRSNSDDVNIIVRSEGKKRVSPDSSVDCSSIGGDSPTRTHSENGSVKAIIKNDRSDAESISTTASHDSELDGVQLRKKEPEIVIVQPSSPKRPTRTKEEIQIANLKKKTRKRTRRFEIDGVQVTTTTSKVIYGDEENGRMYDDHIFRKQELRELKLLQKQEKKQFYDLQAKEQIAKEQQDKKFEQERLALERTYEADMDVLARQHKQQVEKYEQQQENELRNTSKKIRMEQERELKLVRIFSGFFGSWALTGFFFDSSEML
jgi:STE20-like kinase